MSLQQCPHCQQKITFWQAYKGVNTVGHFGRMKCPHCHQKLQIHTQNHSIVGYIAIMIPVVVVIVAVGIQQLNPWQAIGAMVLYHILLIMIIIKWYRYESDTTKD